MSPAIKYTLGRLGLFLLVLLVLWPVPQLSLLTKLLVALLVSFALSWFLLRGWRDQMSAQLADRVERRRAEKERLRAALAGEDEDPRAGEGPAGGPGAEQPEQPEQPERRRPRGEPPRPESPGGEPPGPGGERRGG